ncbi:MAG TPA: ABC transporter permease [Actinocrinis sp.]|nr:ABC transporter permease [Actinocrinis sp.]
MAAATAPAGPGARPASRPPGPPAQGRSAPQAGAKRPHPALSEYSYWMLRYRRVWRSSLVMSFINPLLFFLGIGVGLGRLIDRNGGAPVHGATYLAFLAPGLLAAAAMQTAAIETVMPAYQSLRTRLNYRTAAATPLAPVDILNGHLLFVTFRIATSVAVFFLVLVCGGLASSFWALLALPAAVLTGLAFAAPFLALGVLVPDQGTVGGIYRFLVMPLYLFSGTYVALDQLPAVVRPLGWGLPLWHGVQLCRGLTLGTLSGAAALEHTAYLVGVVVLGYAGARWAYRRRLHD